MSSSPPLGADYDEIAALEAVNDAKVLGAKSLADAANDALLRSLSDRIKQESQLAAFAVGGSIPVASSAGLHASVVTNSRKASDVGLQAGNAGDIDNVKGTDKPDNTDNIKATGIIEDADEVKNTDNVEDDDRFMNSEDDWRSDNSEDPRNSGDKQQKNRVVYSPEICTSSPPVIIRWDRKNSGSLSVCRVSLPIEADQQVELDKLVSDCEPASFGRGDQDVFDESYRKAGKLDETEFSSNFNPYSLGIIDTVARILLPSVADNNVMRSVRAELYKLNVYSGPSGKFKPHVDTPRSTSQFGSLVIGLPCVHSGGQLVVRHSGDEIVFDWSGSDAGQYISWAAFYSDCEHEVLQVTSGHRLTLTYNLYVSSTALPRGLCSINPMSLSFYTSIRDMLDQPGFMKNGGRLGVYCSHAYAHAVQNSIDYLPENLKGVDMVLYQALKSAGLEVQLRPVARNKMRDDDYDRYQRQEERYLRTDAYGWQTSKWGKLGDWVAENKDPRTAQPGDTEWDVKNRVERLQSYEHIKERARLEKLAKTGDIVGKKMWSMRVTHAGGDEDDDWWNIYQDWARDPKYPYWTKGKKETPYEILTVKWLNKPRHKEPAFVHLTYGNQAGIGTVYSAAALIFEVPPFAKRNANA